MRRKWEISNDGEGCDLPIGKDALIELWYESPTIKDEGRVISNVSIRDRDILFKKYSLTMEEAKSAVVEDFKKFLDKIRKDLE